MRIMLNKNGNVLRIVYYSSGTSCETNKRDKPPQSDSTWNVDRL